jgi:hypothetical protein
MSFCLLILPPSCIHLFPFPLTPAGYSYWSLPLKIQKLYVAITKHSENHTNQLFVIKSMNKNTIFIPCARGITTCFQLSKLIKTALPRKKGKKLKHTSLRYKSYMRSHGKSQRPIIKVKKCVQSQAKIMLSWIDNRENIHCTNRNTKTKTRLTCDTENAKLIF